MHLCIFSFQQEQQQQKTEKQKIRKNKKYKKKRRQHEANADVVFRGNAENYRFGKIEISICKVMISFLRFSYQRQREKRRNRRTEKMNKQFIWKNLEKNNKISRTIQYFMYIHLSGYCCYMFLIFEAFRQQEFNSQKMEIQFKTKQQMKNHY